MEERKKGQRKKQEEGGKKQKRKRKIDARRGARNTSPDDEFGEARACN